jgi:hypothetical protein
MLQARASKTAASKASSRAREAASRADKSIKEAERRIKEAERRSKEAEAKTRAAFVQVAERTAERDTAREGEATLLAAQDALTNKVLLLNEKLQTSAVRLAHPCSAPCGCALCSTTKSGNGGIVPNCTMPWQYGALHNAARLAAAADSVPELCRPQFSKSVTNWRLCASA